jgi:hypothetical protein
MGDARSASDERRPPPGARDCVRKGARFDPLELAQVRFRFLSQ